MQNELNKTRHKCPFCGETIEHYENCNGFCKCFAKYYSKQKVWLNRNTGETRKGTYNLELIDDWSNNNAE